MIELRRILAFAVLFAVTAAFMSGERVPGVERHLRLVKSEPAADAMLDAAPAVIELWFSESPEVRVTTIQVTTAGTMRKLEKVAADPEDGKHVIASVDSIGTTGAWAVTWRTMSKDGHVVSGEIPFRVRSAN
jgi:methionine-rich copper-binding protein CopC